MHVFKNQDKEEVSIEVSLQLLAGVVQRQFVNMRREKQEQTLIQVFIDEQTPFQLKPKPFSIPHDLDDFLAVP